MKVTSFVVSDKGHIDTIVDEMAIYDELPVEVRRALQESPVDIKPSSVKKLLDKYHPAIIAATIKHGLGVHEKRVGQTEIIYE